MDRRRTQPHRSPSGHDLGEIEQLTSKLYRIRRRYRRVDAAWGVTRGAWAGLAAALGVLALARLVPVAGDRALALSVAVAWPLSLLGWYLLRRMSLSDVARRVDAELALKDRLATAVALADRGARPGGLVGRQRSDALATADAIEPDTQLPVRADRRRAALTAGLVVLVGALSLLPNRQHDVLAQREAVRRAAEKEAEQVEDAREELEERDVLGDDEQARLNAALDELSDRLRANRGQAEQALADIAAAEKELRELRDRGAVRRGQAAAGLADQLDRLARSTTSGDLPAAGSDGDTASDLNALLEELEGMTDAERQALADRLSELALTASAGLPEAADALSELSDAVRAGDESAAAAAAEAARSAVAQAAAGAEGAQAVEDALARLQGSRQAISDANAASPSAVARAGTGQSTGSPRTAAGQPQSAAGSSAQGAQSSGSSNQGQGQGQGEGQGQGQGDGQGRGQGQGDGQGQGRGEGQGQGEGEGQGEGRGQGQSQGRSSEGGSGAGGGFGRTGQGAPGSEQRASGSGPSQQYEMTGAPQDASPGWDALIYAPGERGDPGRSEFVPGQLSGDAGSRQPRERESRSPGSAAPALVPYDQVFSRYRQAAGEALQREQIPLRLRDYVKQYFAQLEPQ